MWRHHPFDTFSSGRARLRRCRAAAGPARLRPPGRFHGVSFSKFGPIPGAGFRVDSALSQKGVPRKSAEELAHPSHWIPRGSSRDFQNSPKRDPILRTSRTNLVAPGQPCNQPANQPNDQPADQPTNQQPTTQPAASQQPASSQPAANQQAKQPT